MIRTTTLVAALALAPALALAGPPKAGEYLLNDPATGNTVPLCVLADGTWSVYYYGGGNWVYDADSNSTSFFGNAQSDPTDSVVVTIKGSKTAVTEWQPGVYGVYFTGYSAAFNSKTCSVGTHALQGSRLIPR